MPGFGPAAHPSAHSSQPYRFKLVIPGNLMKKIRMVQTAHASTRPGRLLSRLLLLNLRAKLIIIPCIQRPSSLSIHPKYSREVWRMFKNKVAVITGGGSGIGRQTALVLGRADATV